MTIAERITRWRTSREGLTRAVLAKKVGVTEIAVGHWERGTNDPTHENISKIAAAVGVSLAVFWGDPPASPKRKAKAS